MHRALSINSLSLGPGTLAAHVRQVAGLGAGAIGLTLEEVVACGAPAAARLLRETGLVAATLTHRAFGFASAAEAAVGREHLNKTIALAGEIGAQTITMTTGGRGDLPWAEAAARFAEEIAPCAARARAVGTKISLEPTSHLYADASIAHRLADTVDIAVRAGIGVGIDLFACWVDADIEDAIAAAGPHIALVQVSDYVCGDRGLPCRAVPGDGAVPLGRLMPRIVKTGFRGYFDVEVIGPRLEAEGAEAGLRRAGAVMTRLLEAAGY